MPRITAFLWMMTALWGCAEASMSQEAYVWQRSWGARLVTAVEEQARHVDGLTVLTAELMSGPNGEPTGVRVLPDLNVLKSSGRPITFAIRVGQYSGPFDEEAAMTRYLLHEIDQVLQRAKSADLKPAAVEVDFDCATRQLEGYAVWLRLIRQQLNGVPLSITTLPTWMNRPRAFAQLVDETDHFVLQVHSIQRADRYDSKVTLCDPNLAKKWTQAAGRFNKPFHVALPTYAYRLGYNAAGELAEVAAEDASPIQNPNWRYRVIRAEPDDMASLVRSLQDSRPERCLGVIWYRLPIGQERHNWDFQTWLSVMAGRGRTATWLLESKQLSDGLIEVTLLQQSEVATEPPSEVLVTWDGAAPLAWDGQRNYSVTAVNDQSLLWKWPENMSAPLLEQGTRWTIGWLRMETAVTLNISITNDAN
ncbi:DUF3142 domain-containing protein [Coraliomargarita sp. W4R72]